MGKCKVKVKGIVTNGSEYLMLKKWYDDRIGEPYQWEFPEGITEFGESPDHAVERVVSEATGITAAPSKPLYTWQYMLGDVSYIGICYLLYASAEEVVISEEYTESKWLNRLELGNYITDPKMLADIERAEL